MPRRTLQLLSPMQRQAPFLEWDLAARRWRIWLAYNNAATAGTYLDLFGSNPLDTRFIGQVDRVTLAPDGSVVDIVTVLQHL